MNRYRMFVDEVGDHSLKSLNDPINKYLSLTGVILEHNYASKVLYPKFEELKRKFFISHCSTNPVIFHRTDIVNKRHVFNCLLNSSVQQEFDDDLLALLHDLEYEVINVLIDKGRYKEKYSAWTYDTYHYCMRCLVERFHMHLSYKKKMGDIMFESRSPQADKKLSASYNRIYHKGTEFIKSDALKKTFTSHELKLSKKKDNIAGIQLADLLSFAARRYTLDHYKIQPINGFTFNDLIIQVVLARKWRNYNGKVEGFGIKLLP